MGHSGGSRVIARQREATAGNNNADGRVSSSPDGGSKGAALDSERDRRGDQVDGGVGHNSRSRNDNSDVGGRGSFASGSLTTGRIGRGGLGDVSYAGRRLSSDTLRTGGGGVCAFNGGASLGLLRAESSLVGGGQAGSARHLGGSQLDGLGSGAVDGGSERHRGPDSIVALMESVDLVLSTGSPVDEGDDSSSKSSRGRSGGLLEEHVVSGC